MSEETKQQTESTIELHRAKEEETKQHNESSDNAAPKCYCGELMIQRKTSEFTKKLKCVGCRYHFKTEKNECFYQCPKGEALPHKSGYNLCLKCSKYMNSSPIEDIHNPQKLYYVYNDNEINGPLSANEIIQMYIANKIKEKRMYVMSADGDQEWIKLEFPKHTFSEIDKYDEKRCDRFEECEKKNSEMKEKYPDLYEKLIKNIFFDKLQKIVPPKDMPKQERKSSLFKRFMKLLGQILAIFMMTVISLHCLPTLIFSCCCCFICVAVVVHKSDSDDAENIALSAILLIIYLGMVISPILTVNFLLTETDEWNEMQSWMVSYIVWGIFSFSVLFLYLTGEMCFGKEKRDKIHAAIDDMILVIIGVDIGDFNLDDADNFITLIGIIFILPSLASFLPAAICGFIANFVWEEKFELKCSQDIVNNDLCFESNQGCCEIISSHDYSNSYTFIGGLASNILATWAVIRVCGYLLVNAFPELSLYAKRKK